MAAFRERVARRQELAEVLFSLTDKESNFFLADAAERLATAFGGDHRLSQLVAKLQESIQADVPETDPERTRAIHPCELDQAFFEGL